MKDKRAAKSPIASVRRTAHIVDMYPPPEHSKHHAGHSAGQEDRAPRQHVMLNATVERFGGSPPTKHRVRDLSSGGVRIDQAIDMRVGATVLVSVGELEAVGATVVWVKDDSAGLKFAHAVELNQAKAKVAIAPRPSDKDSRCVKSAAKAGWISGLRNPYR